MRCYNLKTKKVVSYKDENIPQTILDKRNMLPIKTVIERLEEGKTSTKKQFVIKKGYVEENLVQYFRRRKKY